MKKGIVRIASTLLVCLLLCVFVAGCAEKPLTLTEQLELGTRYLSELDYENAVIAFTAAIEIDPANAQAYAGLYTAYIAQGEPEKADEVWAAMLDAGVSPDEMLSWVEKMADLITEGGGDGEAVKQAVQEKTQGSESGQPTAADGSSPAYISLQDNQIEVSFTATDITADSVFNSDGYGVLRINEVIENDIGITPRMRAIIDGAGRFVFPYEENWNDLFYSDGVLTRYNSNSRYCGYFSPDGTEEIGDRDIIQGYYSIDGQPIIQFDEVERMQLRPFHDGIAFVRKGNNHAGGAGMEQDESFLIDKNGEIILSLPESISQEVSMGAGPIYVGTEYSVYVLDWDYCGNLGSYSEGLIPFGCRVQLGDSIFNEVDISSVRWDTPMTCGYMDYSGNVVIPQRYSNNYPFSEGLAAVQNNDGHWGYIDKTGKTVIPFSYDSAGSFADGLAAVSIDGKTGYINAQDEIVITFEYDDGFTAGGGVCPVAQNGYYGLIDYNGNEVLPIEYDDISECKDGVVYAVKNRQVYIITVKQ